MYDLLLDESIGTVLISIHPDDVALSIGGSILAGQFRRPLLIATLFTTSMTAPFHRGPRDVETVSTLRQTEDIAYAKSIGSSLVRLDLPDSKVSSRTGVNYYPLRWTSSLLRGLPAPRSRVESALGRIAEMAPRSSKWILMKEVARLDRTYIMLKDRLSALFSRFHDSAFAVPLGVGLHPDHVLGACACRSLVGRRDELYYYEDVPYASEYSPSSVLRHVSLFDRDLRPISVDVSGEMDVKIQKLAIYKSQIGPGDVPKMLRHAERLGRGTRLIERLWSYDNPRS